MRQRPARRLRRYWSRVALTAILGMGAYLRLHDLDLDWFLIDQARDIRKAMGIVRGLTLPLRGRRCKGAPPTRGGPSIFICWRCR